MAPQKIAVIGHPIGHTMSPFIHERLFALSRRPLSYTVLDVPDLKEAIPVLCGLDCFNVTIPHKNAIIPFLDEVEEKAKASGSVNTVQVKQGRLFGYTTDGAGCRAALKNHGAELSGKVLLLGNGGAARAIAFEAAECPGTSLTIVSRENSVEKGQKLCSDLQKYRGVGREVRVLTYAALESEKTEFDVLINATSAGMYPHTGECPVSEEVVSRCSAVFDAVYNPAETELLQRAERLGVKAIGGMEMLVFQAVAAHEIWYGTQFKVSELAVICKDAAEEMRRIFGGKA